MWTVRREGETVLVKEVAAATAVRRWGLTSTMHVVLTTIQPSFKEVILFMVLLMNE